MGTHMMVEERVVDFPSGTLRVNTNYSFIAENHRFQNLQVL